MHVALLFRATLRMRIRSVARMKPIIQVLQMLPIIQKIIPE